MRPFKKLSRFRPLRGRLWGVFNTPLQPATCNPSKYRCDPPTGYVQGFKKWICIRHRRWLLVGRIRYAPITGYVREFKQWIYIRHRRWRMVGRMQYAPTTGYVRCYKILMRFPNWIRIVLQKTVSFSSPLGPWGGRIQYAPTTGYVLSFEKPPRFRSLRGRGVGRIAYAQLNTTNGGGRCPIFVPYGAVCEAYSIRPYNRLRTTLRNTDAISQPGTCEGSKNYPVSVFFGAACGAYSIRPYNWRRAILRNTETISRSERRGCLGGGAVGVTVCEGGGRE